MDKNKIINYVYFDASGFSGIKKKHILMLKKKIIK